MSDESDACKRLNQTLIQNRKNLAFVNNVLLYGQAPMEGGEAGDAKRRKRA